MTEEDSAELVRQAMDILSKGVVVVDRAKVERAFKIVQRAKRSRKENWTTNLRYLYAVTAKQRDAAEKAAVGLQRTLNALRPVANDFQLRVDDQVIDLAPLEKLRQHLQAVAESEVRPSSPFDARKRIAVQEAAYLLEAAGIDLTTTRHGEFDNLSATLWGDPDVDFQELLIEYKHQQGQPETT
jgi:hypothetical protein